MLVGIFSIGILSAQNNLLIDGGLDSSNNVVTTLGMGVDIQTAHSGEGWCRNPRALRTFVNWYPAGGNPGAYREVSNYMGASLLQIINDAKTTTGTGTFALGVYNSNDEVKIHIWGYIGDAATVDDDISCTTFGANPSGGTYDGVLLDTMLSGADTFKWKTEIFPVDFRTGYDYILVVLSCTGNATDSTLIDNVILTTDDIIPPSVPANLITTGQTVQSVALSWDASTDNNVVAGYIIYVDGDSTNFTTTTTFDVTRLMPGTSYDFTVAAIDDADNFSNASAIHTETTLNDTDVPTQVTGLAAQDVTETTLTLIWEPATDNIGVNGYEVFRDAVSIGTTADTFMNVTGLTVNTAYSFTVTANDAAGNTSTVSAPVDVTTPDLTAPAAPTNLASSNVTMTSIDLSWDAATDNVGVIGYIIYDVTDSLTSTASTTITLDGLVAATDYEITVKAYDATDNISAASNQEDVTTLDDTDAPTIPDGLAATDVAMVSLKLHWNPSTDNVGVTGYNIYQDGDSIGATANTMLTVNGLAAVTRYTFTVAAKDAKGNISAKSTCLVVTTIDTEAPAAPANVIVTDITKTSISITWDTATDNVAVRDYVVYVDGTTIGITSNNAYDITGLTEGTTYSITVKSRDETKNMSIASAAIAITTDIIDMIDENPAKAFAFYPNPADDALTITLTEGEYTIGIYTLQGTAQDILPNQTGTVEINISDYSAGIYIVSIKNSKEQVIKKLVIR